MKCNLIREFCEGEKDRIFATEATENTEVFIVVS
jgi:hypothetical protein